MKQNYTKFIVYSFLTLSCGVIYAMDNPMSLQKYQKSNSYTGSSVYFFANNINKIKSKNSLQCLYCEKHFPAPAVLRKHMRKKKHFKINARNKIYDKFYIINYLEPGKYWETFENEHYESDEDHNKDE